MRTFHFVIFLKNKDTAAGSSASPHLPYLLPKHGGAGVDDKHHVLGHRRQVAGSKVVDEVSIQDLGGVEEGAGRMEG